MGVNLPERPSFPPRQPGPGSRRMWRESSLFLSLSSPRPAPSTALHPYDTETAPAPPGETASLYRGTRNRGRWEVHNEGENLRFSLFSLPHPHGQQRSFRTVQQGRQEANPLKKPHFLARRTGKEAPGRQRTWKISPKGESWRRAFLTLCVQCCAQNKPRDAQQKL